MDDFASHPLLRRKENELVGVLKKLRHFNITVVICVQTVVSIIPDIRRNLSDIVLFPGVGKESFKLLFHDSDTGWLDPKEIWEIYRKITDDRTMFVIHNKAKLVIMHKPQASGASSLRP
jgi:hypothetical protein